jgi:O-antigen/teichoic acid export membrane protein
MTELKRLYKDSSQYLLGQVAIFVVGFISFPVFTRVFSVAEYGLMSLTLNTVAMVTVLSKLGLQHSLVRFYPEYAHAADPEAKRRYYSTIFWAASGVAVIVTLLYLLSVWSFSNHILEERLKRLLIFGSVLIFVRAVSSIVMNLWRTEGKTRHYNAVNVGIKAATVAAVIVLLFTWERSLRAFFAGMIGVETVIMITIVTILWKRGLIRMGRLESHFLRQTLAFGFPMIGFELASLILDNGDRFLVQYYIGAQALGYYVAAYNLASYLQEALATPINLALMPIYMNLWVTKGEKETRKFLSEGLDHYLILAIGIVACVAVTAREVIVFLSSKKYQEASELLPILVGGLLVYSLGIFLNAGLLIHKKTFTMARFVVYAAVMNIGLNILLIPRMHLMGAAVATLVACAFLTVLMGYEGLALLPLDFDFVATAKYVVAATCAALVVSRIGFTTPFLNLASRGAGFILIYGGAVWLTNPHLKKLFSSKIVPEPLPMQKASEMAAVAADENEPLMEKIREMADVVGPTEISKDGGSNAAPLRAAKLHPGTEGVK